MAGFREFVTGEVLTAANVDDFLMKQSVQKYADAAARDAALGTAVAGGNALREGMVAWLDDDDELLAYDGNDWVGVGGGLVAVKSAIFTGTMATSTAAGANFAVTDLSITHEVADAANKLIISAFIGVAGNNSGFGNVGLAIHDGSGLIAIGASPGNRTPVTAGSRVATNADGTGRTSSMPSVTFVHTPGAGSKTYTVRAININGDTVTVTINRNVTDSDDATRSRGVSSLVIQEVKV